MQHYLIYYNIHLPTFNYKFFILTFEISPKKYDSIHIYAKNCGHSHSIFSNFSNSTKS